MKLIFIYIVVALMLIGCSQTAKENTPIDKEIKNTLCNENTKYVTDTIDFYDKKIIIQIPSDYQKSEQGYTEGSFKTYTIQSDTAVITVHYGHMVEIPFIAGDNYAVLSEFILKNGNRVELEKEKRIFKV